MRSSALIVSRIQEPRSASETPCLHAFSMASKKSSFSSLVIPHVTGEGE